MVSHANPLALSIDLYGCNKIGFCLKLCYYARRIIVDPCTSYAQFDHSGYWKRTTVAKAKQVTNTPVQFEEKSLLNMFGSQNEEKHRHSVDVCGRKVRKGKIRYQMVIFRN
eukprot:397227_1